MVFSRGKAAEMQKHLYFQKAHKDEKVGLNQTYRIMGGGRFDLVREATPVPGVDCSLGSGDSICSHACPFWGKRENIPAICGGDPWLKCRKRGGPQWFPGWIAENENIVGSIAEHVRKSSQKGNVAGDIKPTAFHSR